MASLLLVEDDETIGSALVARLKAHDHRVSWQVTGRGALRDATGQAFDLVLLDLGLPDLDGVEVCRQLRILQPGCVLVMLTARQDEMDVVVGLESGADDYLTKPFRFAELHARIRAHLRRGGGAHVPPVLCVGALQIDASGRRCTLGGVEIPLRAKEFDLLTRLAQEPGAALTRGQLMADVWDVNWFGSTRTLDVHVAVLRRKLATGSAGDVEYGAVPRIVTLRGHGYRLEVSGDGEAGSGPDPVR